MGYKLENAECKDKAVTPKGNTVAFTGRTVDILVNNYLNPYFQDKSSHKDPDNAENS